MTILATLLLILLGGPAAVAVPLLVARRLVEQHADKTAAEIRAAAEQHQAAEHQAAVERLIVAARTEPKAIAR